MQADRDPLAPSGNVTAFGVPNSTFLVISSEYKGYDRVERRRLSILSDIFVISGTAGTFL